MHTFALKVKRIGILSDTHGHWDAHFAAHFAQCDEIWHAGDIGSMEVAERLATLGTLRAVHGNIDGGELRSLFPEKYRFRCEGVDVLIKHIGGHPGHYHPSVREQLLRHPPSIFVCGHSHILRVEYDETLKMLHINPGAAGLAGWQQVRTLVRLTINDTRISDLEVIELGDKTSQFDRTLT